MTLYHPSMEPDVSPSTTDTTNPKDLLGMKKPPMWLIPQSAMVILSRVMALGAAKYQPYNWRSKKVRATVYVSAAQRHLAQWLDGDSNDEESTVSHLGHVMACCAILLDAQATGNLVDDRPEPGATSRLIKEHTLHD